uniref:Uncharacterized protein n=1 Tax=Molossus molossus TaxID=27622 RepID=A0A7J8I9A3_MOLMO|nr:hypothetical protein HJG59_010685 [Molossus molossus]
MFGLQNTPTEVIPSAPYCYPMTHAGLYGSVHIDSERSRGQATNPRRNTSSALAGLAQWLERRPLVQRDPGLVPTKGTYLGCSLSPALVGRAGGSHSMCPFHVDVSLSLSLSLVPTLSEQKMEKCPRVRIKKKKETHLLSHPGL